MESRELLYVTHNGRETVYDGDSSIAFCLFYSIVKFRVNAVEGFIEIRGSESIGEYNR